MSLNSATFELVVDSTRLQAGAAAASRALDSVSESAVDTGRAVDQSARQAAKLGEGLKQAAGDAQKAGNQLEFTRGAMRNLFQATAGTMQVAGGVKMTAEAFGKLNYEVALFSTSRTLLEIGRTAQDFRELALDVDNVSGRWNKFTAIIKSNPLLAVATALSAVSTAIGFFSEETKKATSAWEEFGAALKKIKIDEAVSILLEEQVPGAKPRTEALRRGIAATYQAPTVNLQQLQGSEFARDVARQILMTMPRPVAQDITQATRMQYTPYGQLERYVATGGYEEMPALQRRERRVEGLPAIEANAEQVRQILVTLYKQYKYQAEQEATASKAAEAAAKAKADMAAELAKQVKDLQDKANEQYLRDDAAERKKLVEEMRKSQKLVAEERAKRQALLDAANFDAEVSARKDMVAGMREYQKKLAAVRFLEAGPGREGVVRSELAEAGQQYAQAMQFRADMTRQLPGYQQILSSYRTRNPEEIEIQSGDSPILNQFQQMLENGVATAAMIALYKKKEAEDAERVAKNFERAADYAGQVGGSMGAAFADVLMKTTTLRQAFASIVASFARQGLSDIGTAIFRGAVNGLTPQQSANNQPAKT